MLKADWTPQNAKETYERDSPSPNQTAPVPQTARTHYPACKSLKAHHRRTLNNLFSLWWHQWRTLVSLCKLTFTFGSRGKGLYGNTESTWQLHSVRMSFISMWPLIYLKSLFKIFLSKIYSHSIWSLKKYICMYLYFWMSLWNLNCKATFPKHFKCLNNGCISEFLNKRI